MKNFYSLHFFALSILCFLSSNTFSQSFNWIQSGYRTDCSNGVYPRDITTDVNDNIISVGYYYATTANAVSFGTSQLLGYTNNFESNTFIVKYNNSGAIQWLKRIGTDRDDGTYPRVESDNSGNVIVAAELSGTTSGTPGYIDGTTMTQNVLANDAVIAKFSSSGVLNWYKHFTGTGNVTIYDIKTDSKGDMFITGSFNGALIIDNTNFSGSSGLNNNFFIAKLSASGNLLWWKNATGSGSDAGYRLHVNDTSVYVLGVFSETNSDTDMTLNNTTYTIPNANYDAVFVAKYGTSGSFSWLKYGYLQDNGGGNGTAPYYSDITADSAGNVYSIFSLSQSGVGSIFMFPNSTSTYTCTGNGGTDYVMTKHSANGNLLFVAGDGGASSGNNVFPTSMIMHSNNQLFATFMVAGTINIDSTLITSAGSEDAVLARFDSNGDIICHKQYGGTNQDWPMAIEELSNGHIAYTGHVFGGTTAGVITNYNGQNITGCRNTGITGSIDTTGCYNISTNILNITENNKVTLYPNPAKNTITINFNQNINQSNINIYNIFGQLIYRKNNFSANTETIDITALSSGIYYIELISEELTTQIKFVKE